jgi:hypothetical protein
MEVGTDVDGLLPFADQRVLDLFARFEKAAYERRAA